MAAAHLTIAAGSPLCPIYTHIRALLRLLLQNGDPHIQDTVNGRQVFNGTTYGSGGETSLFRSSHINVNGQLNRSGNVTTVGSVSGQANGASFTFGADGRTTIDGRQVGPGT